MRHRLLLQTDSEVRGRRGICNVPDANDGARLRRKPFADRGGRHAFASSELLRDSRPLGGSAV